MSNIICICPTHRDHRELAALRNGHTFLYHDYASLALEDLTAAECAAPIAIADPEPEIESVLNRCRQEQVRAVITTDDYPGTTLASVVGDELNVPAPSRDPICCANTSIIPARFRLRRRLRRRLSST